MCRADGSADQLFNEFKGREILRIEGPLGDFFLREESDKPIIFVAGGTGFAPIKAHHRARVLPQHDRQMVLYWGVRSLRDLYLPNLPGEWQRKRTRTSLHSGAVGPAARETNGPVGRASCTRP